MKHILIIAIALLTIMPTFSQDDNASKTTTYYFIRHAEKDRSDKTNKDPNLTDVGKTRAGNWSTILSHVKFDAVYSTNYNRTKQTAQPTATKNKLEINIYDPRHIDAKTFMNETGDQTVLVVGHSDTTPMFVNAVLGKKTYKMINDHNNGNLYIITIIDGKVSDKLLVIN